MKIKTKLTLGVGLLFLLIILLATIGISQIWNLSEDTKNILQSNYNTLDYAGNMLDALDKIAEGKNAVGIFRENLEKQQNNITEIGEKAATDSLAVHFEALLKAPENTIAAATIRRDLSEIISLNMSAIQRKSRLAEKTADKAIIWIGITGSLCFLIAFVLMVNMPGNIANPIRELTDSIRQIAGRKYDQRVNFKSGSEFGELAEAFNTMAAKLQEYESSILSKILFQKKRTEALIEQMHEPIIGLDEQRNVLFANGGALKLLYLKKEDIVGKPAEEVGKFNDLFRVLTSDLTSQSPVKTEPLKIFVDGRENWFEKEVIAVEFSATGETKPRHIGDVIILKNVTAFKEVDAAKTNYLSAIFHELRTHTSSLLAKVGMLEKATDTERHQTLGSMQEDGEQLLKITGALMNLSQVENGNIPLTFQQMNPQEVLNYALENVRNQAAQRQVNLVVEADDNLPVVSADTDKIAWVLTSFLVNAIRYSPEKNDVRVALKNEGNSIRFSVTDAGRGIDTKQRERIFERYFHRPGDGKGIGLALSMSKEFIEAQGGEIGVESGLGMGSTFWFSLNV